MRLLRDAHGTAVVEFIVVTVAMLVPLVYAVSALADLSRAQLAMHRAAKVAGRAYVNAGSDAVGRYAALRMANMAARDQGFVLVADDLRITCDAGDCLQPGTEVRVTVRTRLALLRVPTGIPSGPIISATHTHIVDPARAPA